jgi:hypothetical protein
MLEINTSTVCVQRKHRGNSKTLRAEPGEFRVHLLGRADAGSWQQTRRDSSRLLGVVVGRPALQNPVRPSPRQDRSHSDSSGRGVRAKSPSQPDSSRFAFRRKELSVPVFRATNGGGVTCRSGGIWNLSLVERFGRLLVRPHIMNYGKRTLCGFLFFFFCVAGRTKPRKRSSPYTELSRLR